MIKLPEIANDAATISVGSDRYPATVVHDDGKIIELRANDYKVVKGSAQDGSAEYEYYDGETFRYNRWTFRRRNGQLEEVVFNPETGRYNKLDSSRRLYIGRREAYYDPHF